MTRKIRLAGLLVPMLVSAAIGSRAVDAQDAPRKIEITAKRFNYEPSEITLKKGQPVALVITSKDVSHGLRIRELNLNAKIPKGGSTELDFTPNNAGDFIGHCSVFCGSGHGGMMLKFHVVE